MTALSLNFEPEALEPLIRHVVEETLARLEAERGKLDGRLAYSEPEAAALLGLQAHQLRDERRRSRIAASTIVGKWVRYLHEDLVRHLMAGRGAARRSPAVRGKSTLPPLWCTGNSDSASADPRTLETGQGELRCRA